MEEEKLERDHLEVLEKEDDEAQRPHRDQDHLEIRFDAVHSHFMPPAGSRREYRTPGVGLSMAEEPHPRPFVLAPCGAGRAAGHICLDSGQVLD